MQLLTSTRLVLCFQIMIKHVNMCITIPDIVREKRFNLGATASMFSNNVQYQIKEPLKGMLMNKEKRLPEGTFRDRELNASVGRKVIMLLDIHDHSIKKNKKLQGASWVAVQRVCEIHWSSLLSYLIIN